VPPRKALRAGQRQVVEAARAKKKGLLTVQLPTGYGKTLAAAAVFAVLRALGVVDRLLYLVPTTAQLRQFCDDGESDFHDIGLAGVHPFEIGYSPALALKKHRSEEAIVFAATIQSVVSGPAALALKEMMLAGRWMVVVDEYHHYGLEKAWGRAVLGLKAEFTLAMSATPDRKGQDGAFGKPEVRVSYRQAVHEEAAKRLSLHAYEYRVDAITVDNEPITFTTSEISDVVGSSDPHAIDKYMVERKLRWSPKYISPLVSIPIERLLAKRRNFPLQMIVGAMGCHHAQMVCEQIRSMFGDLLRIDWVGTGPFGRSDAENEAVLSRFCPRKRDGRRRIEDVKVDVLVHVGKAGEGLDSVFVAEVVHLNPASITNQNDQENGRAARHIPGAPDELQEAIINVDSSSPYAQWPGPRIMDVFDRANGEAPPDKEDGDGKGGERDPGLLADEPLVVIADCELQGIDKGDPEVRMWAEHVATAGSIDRSVLEDTGHWIYEAAIRLRRKELLERAQGQEGMSVLAQLRATLHGAVGSVASVAARQTATATGRFERSLLGDMKKRINTEMRKRHGCGVDEADEDGLRERYAWIKQLDRSIRSEGLPPWLR